MTLPGDDPVRKREASDVFGSFVRGIFRGDDDRRNRCVGRDRSPGLVAGN